jgi:uncharacterized RDD family membrane protein YckC
MVTRTLITEKNSLLWKRITASFFDVIFVGLLVLVIHMLSPKPVPVPMTKWIMLAVFMTYSILFDYYLHGTPGKHMMKIKILYTHDKRSYLLTTFYRNVLKVVSFSGFYWMLGAPYRQGLHNRIAKCMIVEDVGNR